MATKAQLNITQEGKKETQEHTLTNQQHSI